MTLMLRKAAQPILDRNDLDPYHVEINETNKHMELKTLCGKPFATVHGVVFSRLAPTHAEIEFACELLQAWVARNKKDFDVYHDALETLQVLSNTPRTKQIGEFECIFSKTYNYIEDKKVYKYYVRVKNKNLTCLINKNNMISELEFGVDFKFPTKLDALMPSKSDVADMLKLLEANLKLEDARNNKERIHDELNSCNVLD